MSVVGNDCVPDYLPALKLSTCAATLYLDRAGLCLHTVISNFYSMPMPQTCDVMLCNVNNKYGDS